MLRSYSLVLGLLLFSSAAFGQAAPAPPESPTLQALLAEIRQLRQDLLTSATAARRAQIVIYRLHAQEGVLARATQRMDDAKSELTQLRARNKELELQKKQYEEIRDRTENANQRKHFEDILASLALKTEALTQEEPEAQSKAAELEQQWRIEQVKFEQLQDELDRLDRAVMNAALHSSTREK